MDHDSTLITAVAFCVCNSHYDSLGGLAVLAAFLRALGHQPTQGLRDGCHLCAELQLFPDVMPAPLQHQQSA